MKERGIECLFNNYELIKLAYPEGDPNPCRGEITKHHVKPRRNGGNCKGNLVKVCQGHHDWINSTAEKNATTKDQDYSYEEGQGVQMPSLQRV